MRTTLNLNDDLVARAAELTGVKEKTALVRLGLEALITLKSSERLARTISTGTHKDSIHESLMIKLSASRARRAEIGRQSNRLGKWRCVHSKAWRTSPRSASFDTAATTIRPPGRKTRLHWASTRGISGVSKSSGVKDMKIPSNESGG